MSDSSFPRQRARQPKTATRRARTLFTPVSAAYAGISAIIVRLGRQLHDHARQLRSSASPSNGFGRVADPADPTGLARFTVVAAFIRNTRFTRLARLASVRLSTLGWIMVAICAICLIAFPFTGWHELLACGVTILALLVFAAWFSTKSPDIGMRIDLDRLRVGVRDRVTITLAARNPGTLPIPALHGVLAIGQSHASVSIPALGAQRSERITRTYQAAGRATIRIGPFTTRTGDPFALMRRRDALAEPVTLYVHPPTVDLGIRAAGIVRDMEGRAHGGIVDDDLDFHGLRPYAPGDDIRNVHWLSSSKSDDLMTRQYESTLRTGSTLSIDLDSSGYCSREEFELAISLGASVGSRCLRNGDALTVCSEASCQSAPDATTLLDWCSTLEPDAQHTGIQHQNAQNSQDCAKAALHQSQTSVRYLAVGSLANVAAIRRASLALHTHARVVVLQADLGASMQLKHLHGFTLARFGDLHELATAGGAL
ncbi:MULTISPECIES: DUF58 domain-containing protein [Bifidobacterium]|uniref:DUF58 domain-containing protein n=1 Tax=Bifidobacterium tibiigranuli TaxID=2172043 RepID=A0A5N6RYS6_9BIFI|nr:DUF58 domain-containing protein [Bifidobacterium tibiigranuli]KAE8127027.1 DUF58 domain-containing protein [Bifidobacterium tibiigranuli]KAE8127775.1 DUF58 domain-containing protein [Bifidobacterium tibiigranuli]MCI1211502.1 DUF58 domain-containing protein [Bifidobacterium tibiigranuli]